MTGRYGIGVGIQAHQNPKYERLVILALDVNDEPEALRQFLRKRALSYTVLKAGKVDGPVATSYGVTALQSASRGKWVARTAGFAVRGLSARGVGSLCRRLRARLVPLGYAKTQT
jgi:hypothetical protein